MFAEKKNIPTIVLLIGVGALGGFVAGQYMGTDVSRMGHDMPDGTYMKGTDTMHDSMVSMMGSLEGKSGDALDKAFLEEMIVHHEGAVEMARAVKARGSHAELQTLADAIIEAQTKEIAQMRAWQQEWYPGTAE